MNRTVDARQQVGDDADRIFAAAALRQGLDPLRLTNPTQIARLAGMVRRQLEVPTRDAVRQSLRKAS